MNIESTTQLRALYPAPSRASTRRCASTKRQRCAPTPPPSLRSPTTSARPKLVIEVSVAEAYLHCAKALMRSALWDPASRVDRSVLPSMGRMINDQTGIEAPAESQAAMLARYAADL